MIRRFSSPFDSPEDEPFIKPPTAPPAPAVDFVCNFKARTKTEIFDYLAAYREWLAHDRPAPPALPTAPPDTEAALRFTAEIRGYKARELIEVLVCIHNALVYDSTGHNFKNRGEWKLEAVQARQPQPGKARRVTHIGGSTESNKLLG